MRVLSFDVGIKNMAYCLFDLSGSHMNVHKWNVLNLMTENNTSIEVNKCSCMMESTNKKKNIPVKKCEVKAKYVHGEHTKTYYCEKHAKKSNLMLPNKECSPQSLKKMKLIELSEMYDKYIGATSTETIVRQKKPLLEKLHTYFEKNMLEVIKKEKIVSAGETNLIVIGRNMKKLLDQEILNENITHVIIENQISPIANRMKTIQGMLAQYFIMTRGDDCAIDVVSSINKLKGFNSDPVETTETDTRSKYQQHKKDSVVICSRFISNNENLQCWKNSMECNKKDDLADCFLQGIWYLKNQKKTGF